MNGPTLKQLGDERTAALDTVEQRTEQIITEVARAIRAGEEVNISEVERLSGITRRTIYTRLEQQGVRP